MELEQRISSLAGLGGILSVFTRSQRPKRVGSISFTLYQDILNHSVKQAGMENLWFTPEYVLEAFRYWGRHLSADILQAWVNPYREKMAKRRDRKRIGIVMAGNIPMVGFHDLLCVLITGNNLVARLSSQDSKLIPALVECLCLIEPGWSERIELTTGKIKNPDAIIATGSNNTSRYFDYYFGKYPHIIRKNRTSVALLTGHETLSDLKGFARDVFSFYGLGCRNISKVYVPDGYDFTLLHQAFSEYQNHLNHPKYRNNHDYFKSVLLLNKTPFVDGGFYMLIEQEQLNTPVSQIHYAYYSDIQVVIHQLNQLSDQIQCIVCADRVMNGIISPGQTHDPELWDYADGVDTIRFLLEKI